MIKINRQLCNVESVMQRLRRLTADQAIPGSTPGHSRKILFCTLTISAATTQRKLVPATAGVIRRWLGLKIRTDVSALIGCNQWFHRYSGRKTRPDVLDPNSTYTDIAYDHSLALDWVFLFFPFTSSQPWPSIFKMSAKVKYKYANG